MIALFAGKLCSHIIKAINFLKRAIIKKNTTQRSSGPTTMLDPVFISRLAKQLVKPLFYKQLVLNVKNKVMKRKF